MKFIIATIIFSLFSASLTVYADDRQSRNNRSYDSTKYKLEKKYPSPEHRYSRKELDQARRRANNSLWMKNYGKRDPIYRSDQYWGQSYRNYRQPYRR